MTKPSDCSPAVQGEIIRLLTERGLKATQSILCDEWPIRRSPRLIPEALEFTTRQLRYFAEQQGLETLRGKKTKIRVVTHDEYDPDVATDLPTA